ncbi:hypothetical protein SCLCIDRAFT_1071780 [Scleroderma citrinum Foug A]|uniref:Uncharacterized protein n=1 Tax=Scleroderma citrinum Foug A TaxID=1036808 RepID=A0A0C3EHS8_9AGAM|nr:hypothetical protein SCLCIDRAFT_1071780 [Scleroderma citrinum Foug A]
MTNNQPKIRRPKLKAWRTKPVPVTSDAQFVLNQGSSSALTPNIAATSARSTDIAPGKLARLKNLLSFKRSNQAIVNGSRSIFRIIKCCSLSPVL